MQTSGVQNWFLLGLGVLLSLVGVVSIWSAQLSQPGADGASKQLAFLGLAVATYLILGLIPFRLLLKSAVVGWVFSLVTLALVLVFGVEVYGSKRWFDFGPIHWQPSEFAKLVIILCGAAWLPAFKRLFDDRIAALLYSLLFVPHLVLVLLGPDLGTTLSMTAIILVQLVAGPLSLQKLAPFLLVIFVLVPLAGFPFLQDYQRARITGFLQPDQDLRGRGYQVAQSKIAIGSGGFAGKGWGQGTQNRLNFIPGQHTDFIFTVIGEEGGFLGSLGLLLLYFLLFGTLLFFSVTCGDVSASLVGVGVLTLLGIHALVNVAMTIGAAPVTGIPLPFMSYGGSALLHAFMALGLVNSAGRAGPVQDDFAPGL